MPTLPLSLSHHVKHSLSLSPPLYPTAAVRRHLSSSSSSSSSPPHHDLATFLAHASRTSLRRTSPTYLGTLYEYLAQRHLAASFAFDLSRVGGRNDSGIDLLGTWRIPVPVPDTPVPPVPTTTPVLVQCKYLTGKTGPHLVRELEGAFLAAPTGWRVPRGMGVLVCTRTATRGVREAMGRSARGLVWVTLTVDNEEGEGEGRGEAGGGVVVDESGGCDGDKDTAGSSSEDQYRVPKTSVVQFLYNAAAASKCGLEGVNVGVKYDSQGTGTNIQLLWQGEPIDFSKNHRDTSGNSINME